MIWQTRFLFDFFFWPAQGRTQRGHVPPKSVCQRFLKMSANFSVQLHKNTLTVWQWLIAGFNVGEKVFQFARIFLASWERRFLIITLENCRRFLKKISAGFVEYLAYFPHLWKLFVQRILSAITIKMKSTHPWAKTEIVILLDWKQYKNRKVQLQRLLKRFGFWIDFNLIISRFPSSLTDLQHLERWIHVMPLICTSILYMIVILCIHTYDYIYTCMIVFGFTNVRTSRLKPTKINATALHLQNIIYVYIICNFYGSSRKRKRVDQFWVLCVRCMWLKEKESHFYAIWHLNEYVEQQRWTM